MGRERERERTRAHRRTRTERERGADSETTMLTTAMSAMTGKAKGALGCRVGTPSVRATTVCHHMRRHQAATLKHGTTLGGDLLPRSSQSQLSLARAALTCLE